MTPIKTPPATLPKGSSGISGSARSVLLFGVAFLPILSGAAGAQQMNHDSLYQLFGEPVTASAIGKPQRTSESPSTIHIITAEEIRRSGAYNIAQILERVVGLDVLNSNIAQQSIGVRGFAKPQASQTLIMVNGRHLFSDDLYEVEWNTQPIELSEIQQIEIVKGPGSALFGFNAFRGVVNIITKDPLTSPVNTASIRVGNFDYRQFSAVKSITFSPSVAARISAGYTLSDQFTAKELPGTDPGILPIDMDLNNRNARRRAVAGDLSWRIDDRSHLRVEASWGAGEHSSQWATWSNVYSRQKILSARTAYSVDSSWGLINLSAFTNQYELEWTPNYSGVPIPSEADVYVARVEDLVKIGTDHTLRFSGEYRWGFAKGENYGPGGPKISQDNIAAGAMWDWMLSPAVTLTNSVRLDRTEQWRKGEFFPGAGALYGNADFDRVDYAPSFNSYLTWRVSNADTLRLTVGHAPQLTPFCEVACQTDGDYLYAGSPQLPFATNTAYELAYDRDIEMIDGQFRSAFSYQQMRHSKGFSTTPVDPKARPLVFPVINTGASDVFGFEVELHGKIGQTWYWQADYSFIEIDDDPTRVVLDSRSVVNHPMEWAKTTSKHKIGARLGFTAGAWEGEIYGRRYSARKGFAGGTTFELPVPAYVSADARLAYSPMNDVTLSVEGSNLFDTNHIETNGVRIGTRYSVSLSVQF